MADCFSTWGLVPWAVLEKWQGYGASRRIKLMVVIGSYLLQWASFSTPWSSSLIYARMDFELCSSNFGKFVMTKAILNIATCLIKPKPVSSLCMFVCMDVCMSVCLLQEKCLRLTIWCSWSMALDLCVTCALEALLNVVSVSHFISWNDLKTIRRTLSLYFKVFPPVYCWLMYCQKRLKWSLGNNNLYLFCSYDICSS